MALSTDILSDSEVNQKAIIVTLKSDTEIHLLRPFEPNEIEIMRIMFRNKSFLFPNAFKKNIEETFNNMIKKYKET